MKYNLAITSESIKAQNRLDRLKVNKSVVEIKRINPNRTLNQNSYLHLILGYYGLQVGYTLEEAKIVYKREINPDIYVYEKNGKKFMRSSADLDVEEMAKTIDKLHRYAAEQGFPLPQATDQEWLRQIENEIELSKGYL